MDRRTLDTRSYLNALRARKPFEYVYDDSFDDPAQAKAIIADMPDQEKYDIKLAAAKPPDDDVPPETILAYFYPLLTFEQQYHMFRKMNYQKHRANAAQLRIRSLVTAQSYEDLYEQAVTTRNFLVSSNYRLVLNFIKKLHGDRDHFLSEADYYLMRAVECFKFNKPNGKGGYVKFSTYAINAFWKSILQRKPTRQAINGLDDDVFEAPYEDDFVEQDQQELDKRYLDFLLAQLDPRERKVLVLRNGLSTKGRVQHDPLTLREVGTHLRITKERVRQIEAAARKKLRGIAERGEPNETPIDPKYRTGGTTSRRNHCR